MSSGMPIHGKEHFKNNSANSSHNIQIRPTDLSITNKNIEQTEPMDLSCVKNSNSNVVKKTLDEVKHHSYFEARKSDVPLPLPSNINEATLLILKSVYDIKYHRKPNCDQIFHQDPVNPKLFVCKVCAKHVRSKWHHFQTHYSRDHKCSDCDAVYSRIDTLRTHAKKRHHTVIPRYYYGIPANVWHRVVVQLPDPLPKPTRPRPAKPPTGDH
ncbi:sex determination protein fruitless-like isoform X2 [Aphis craccivora]|uniref:Sex determination protein fruitless-like isoform X2 n=1 Tax=Aphis craccivora TaxID=307492 RepID=A0A6G0YGC3_APHCR|nr:sex determination protein fruitless-like isoform X2 [Aphis craccivora]